MFRYFNNQIGEQYFTRTTQKERRYGTIIYPNMYYVFEAIKMQYTSGKNDYIIEITGLKNKIS